MKTWVWVVVGGIALGLFLMYYPNHNQLPSSTRPAKVKPKSPVRIPSTIKQVSDELSGHYDCKCVNNILTGPGCSTLTGKKCSDFYKFYHANLNCKCIGGVQTGVGCPFIGQSCLEAYGNLYDKPAHIHTKCLPGEMLMEGGGCVKVWDNSDRYGSNQTSAV